MKKILLAFAIFGSCLSWGQQAIKPTEGLTISGEVKKEMKFTLADLNNIPSVPIKDVVITNHLGEPRGTAKNLKGFLLKTLLDKIEFQVESPKLLSEFYFIFVASDGYKLVFSWNEIFNTETGNNLYLVTEKEGKKMNEMNDRILIIVTTDLRTGRRYLKGLEKIVVKRAE